MDFKKCRTCFADLESNDLFLKLSVTHKSSTISLADKLKKCVPVMELKHTDKLYICMQCSMHLETAYTFYMTCLETEGKFHNHNTRKRTRAKTLEIENPAEEDQKPSPLFCECCNVHFRTKNIFDLHMTVMHAKQEIPIKQAPKEESDEESKFTRHERRENPLFQMVFLQTNIATSTKGDTEESDKTMENKVRALRINKNSTTLLRNPDGTFQKRNSSKRKLNMKDVKLDVKKKKDETSESNNQKSAGKVSLHKEVNVKPEKIDVEVNKRNSSFSCRFCSKKFTKPGLVTTHIGISHRNKCLCCVLCYRFYTNWKKHKKQYGCQLQNIPKQGNIVSIEHAIWNDKTIYYTNAAKKSHIMCLICMRVCPNLLELDKHIETSHPADIQCKLCFKTFSPMKFCSHIGQGCCRLVQESKFNYTSDGECICPLCNNVFHDRMTLRSHLACHIFAKLECNDCQERFNKITTYCQHIVKGCEKTISDERINASVFLKNEDECQETPPASTSRDPLNQELVIPETQSRAVKIEPTELLDQNGFICNEDSRNDDNLVESESIERYIDVEDDETVVKDTPDLVYIVQNMEERTSE